ncbi:MAG: hypothetical protein EOO47_05675 [Flavobacterium sp.]|nr:MAG: hypothetical protein EOO47_05675 [Flavobacterium sp.]
MHSAKPAISKKEYHEPLKSNAHEIINKRNLLRGYFLLFCFLWSLALGVTLYLKGEEWWPTALSILFVSPMATLPLILKIKNLNNQLKREEA